MVANRLPVPGRSVWWLAAAMLGGLAMPSIVAAFLTMAGFYPIGSALPQSWVFRAIGAMAVAFGMGMVIFATIALYALIAWNWRPLVLAVLFALFGILGLLPAMLLTEQMSQWAFGLFAERSATLIAAIEGYSVATGAPPDSLSALVPQYLAEFPRTGMAAHPDYRYVPRSGPCSIESGWHLTVDVPVFMDMNVLLYCPDRNYNTAVYPILSRTAIGAWVHDRIAF